MHSVSIRLGSLMIAVLIVAAASNVLAKDADWKKLSDGIRMALISDNEGVQQSALRMVIKYGKNLDIEDSVQEMIRIYRSQSDEQLRRLVLLAIYQIDEKQALQLLSEQLDRETQTKRSEFVKLYSR